jgi:cytochrome c biogenesis protein CcdA/thiol-disulfide isomerase/thioredoxin
MFLIAFLGGIVTVLSPCILPVVPFLFARADRSAASILMTLLGLMLTFALVSSLAVVSSDWVVAANGIGRNVALVVLVLFALSLLSARVSHWLTLPLVALGNRLDPATRRLSGPFASVLIGVATGLLWAPCAGPILGIILSGAMLQGPNPQTSLLLLAYGLGSAVSLGVVIFAGRGLLARLKLSLPVTAWVRRGTGLVALLVAVSIATGTQNQLLAGTSSQRATAVEKGLLSSVPKAINYVVSSVKAATAPDVSGQGEMPSLSGASAWLNSPELAPQSLRGKVVLVDFWTFDCINCQHSIAHVNEWAKKYEKDGLVVIGVHTPEYPYERVIDNVRKSVARLGLNYPIAIDNDYAIWRAFDNQYWPAHYLVDAQGQIRYSHFGEGAYEEQEQVIRQLLDEARKATPSPRN